MWRLGFTLLSPIFVCFFNLVNVTQMQTKPSKFWNFENISKQYCAGWVVLEQLFFKLKKI